MIKSFFEIITERAEDIGLKKGVEIGLKKGEEKKALEVAVDCIKLGMDINMIAKIARITTEKVEAIRDSIQQGTFSLQS